MSSDSQNLLLSPSKPQRQQQHHNKPRPKSPPLAFERTSNDALAPLTSPPTTFASPPTPATMGRHSPPLGSEGHNLQVIVDQQCNAITRLHEAFAAERQCWALEKERLHQRIGNLERLLRSRDHGYSPAKSPIASPTNGTSITSPQARSMSLGAPRLPSIAEDENIQPYALPEDRDTTDLPSIPSTTQESRTSERRRSSVTFETGDGTDEVLVEEVPISPPTTARASPPPAANTDLAGHTPLKNSSRPPTPPPARHLLSSIDDTPTRNNTHINTLLTKSDPDDTTSPPSDKALNGPLNLPSLPHKPGHTNFTMELLSQKLAEIEKSPSENLPTVFSEPSPGLAAPEAPGRALSSGSGFGDTAALSLTASKAEVASVLGAVVDGEEVGKEDGGIRLKKKMSTNFGAPFGSLGGFGRNFS